MKVFSKRQWMTFLSGCWLLCLAGLAYAASLTDGAAMVTAVEGRVSRVGTAAEAVQAFIRLGVGETLVLEDGARIRLVFFGSRRQESWNGKGRLEIAKGAGIGHGLAEPEVKLLPEMLVRQVAKTPTLDTRTRAGMVRLRAIPTPEAIAKLDRDFKQLRDETMIGDLNPELFLLAGLLEMRQFERIENILDEMQVSHEGRMDVKVLISLYRKSLKTLRESGK